MSDDPKVRRLFAEHNASDESPATRVTLEFAAAMGTGDLLAIGHNRAGQLTIVREGLSDQQVLTLLEQARFETLINMKTEGAW